MFRKWEFWRLPVGSGLAITLTGWAGKWDGAPGDPANYSDETTWAIWIGILIMALGIAGIVYCAAFARGDQPQSPPVDISSRNQRGGITAHTVNLGNRKGNDGKER